MQEEKRHVEEQRNEVKRIEQKELAKSTKLRKIVRLLFLAQAGVSYGLGFMFRLHDIKYNEILIGLTPIFVLVFFLLRNKKTSDKDEYEGAKSN
jgi:hypothetical protein